MITSERYREIAERVKTWLGGGEPQDVEEITADLENDAIPPTVLLGVIGQLLDEIADHECPRCGRCGGPGTPSWSPTRGGDYGDWEEARDAAIVLNGGVPASEITELREQVAQSPAMPVLEADCTDCPTDGERAENVRLWRLWNDREAGAYSQFAASYDRTRSNDAAAVAWKSTGAYRALVAEQPDDMGTGGCLKCNYTGRLPTAAGRQLIDFLHRYTRA